MANRKTILVINKIDNIKISDGKHSKEKLKRSETKNSYEEEDMK